MNFFINNKNTFDSVESSFKYSLVRKDDVAKTIIKVLNSNSIGITDLSKVGHITNKKLVDAVNGSLALIKDNGNREIDSFPYFVKKDICLNSQKMTIDLPILEALKIEAENYWLLR